MFITFLEVLNALIMSFIVGFIFSDYVSVKDYVTVRGVQNIGFGFRFSFRDLLFSSAIVAPAIILHELGHKFVALSFGLQATFHVAYTWLAIGLLLKLFNFGFIFFVPAYVSIIGEPMPLSNALIAFAGPGVNILLYLVSSFFADRIKGKSLRFFIISKQINKWLALFNLLPIPGFDGWHVVTNLIMAVSKPL